LVKQLVISVFTAANTLISVPVVGAALEVIVVGWCAAMLVTVLTKLAHCVAVTVPPVLTVDNAVCPYVVFQVALTLALTVVLTKPL
jgi:hypothetical protein